MVYICSVTERWVQYQPYHTTKGYFMNSCKAFLALLVAPIALFAADVGPLNHAGVVVSDLDLAITQWQSGTGNQFRDIQSNTYEVHFSQHKSQTVTLRSSFSKLNSPFV